MTATADEQTMLVGVQGIGPSVLSEGASHMVSWLREVAGVNALFISTHGGTYGGKGVPAIAGPDHGVTPAPPPPGDAPTSWIDWDPNAYTRTPLKQHRDATRHAWADRDVLAELIPPARKAGTKVFARHLEDFHGGLRARLPGYESVLSVNPYGRAEDRPCWNHPDYRQWWLAMTRDWCARYDIDGLLLGPERDGPLSPMLYAATMPVCFCDHCLADATREGVDVARAREGMRRLYELVLQLRDGRAPEDGALVSILREVLRWPEVVQWERLQDRAKWSLHAEIRALAHQLRPGTSVGWMVPVYPLMHDIFSRALSYDYATLAGFSDYLKINVYQDVNAARLRDWVDRPPIVYRDLAKPQLFDLIYSVFGYDPAHEPTYESSWDHRFGATYVTREVGRCVRALRRAGANTRVYAGIGVDISHDRITRPDPQAQYDAVTAALTAGADGLVFSREYHLMTRPTLEASGKAVRDFLARPK